jgi:class 3 adenylate cyclase/pimeloyl-ACP methyl ester carboxylesterase
VDVETHFARSGDVNIAYQITGDGPFDLVMVSPFVSHVELIWQISSFVPVLEGFGKFSRLIRFDKRGTGMSDRVSGAPTLETRMDDVRAVMDAIGSQRAALYGAGEGGAMCLLFAATYPERTAALVLASAPPRTMWAPDYPWGLTEDDFRRQTERQLALFGPRERARETVREMTAVDDEADIDRYVDYLRWGSSPGAVEALALMNKEIDVRHVLPAIRVPTQIRRRVGETAVPHELAELMAQKIAGAEVVEVPGTARFATGSQALQGLGSIGRFLTETWESGGWEDQEPDRVLATVLFTDIVGSSEKASELGDRAWRELLERHHALVRRELVRFRGREVDTVGDGFFASFDGPARAIRSACAIVEQVRELGLEVRVGLHTGECEVVDGKVAGIAVHTGTRVAAQAGPGEVLVSSTVKDLVAGSGLRFEDRGAHELKGVPGEWRLFAVDRLADGF